MIAAQLLVDLSLVLEGWHGCQYGGTYGRYAMAMVSCRVFDKLSIACTLFEPMKIGV